MSLQICVCMHMYCMSVHVIANLCMYAYVLYVTACQCMSLQICVCMHMYCMSLHVSACHCKYMYEHVLLSNAHVYVQVFCMWMCVATMCRSMRICMYAYTSHGSACQWGQRSVCYSVMSVQSTHWLTEARQRVELTHRPRLYVSACQRVKLSVSHSAMSVKSTHSLTKYVSE